MRMNGPALVHSQALARKLSSIQIPQTTTVVLTLLLTVVYLNILHAVQLHPIGPCQTLPPLMQGGTAAFGPLA